jgi:TldD protein
MSAFPATLAHFRTRRDWLTGNAAALVAARFGSRVELFRLPSAVNAPVWMPHAGTDSPTRDVLAQRAVEAARRAGAQYAEARLTHILMHSYNFMGPSVGRCKETVGIGIRTLVNGYWGFAATPGGDIAEVERLARTAVEQANVNARGTPRTVELSTVPPAVGQWIMPVRIDPFKVPIEEKLAMMQYWSDLRTGCRVNRLTSSLYIVQQSQVVANSDGAHFAQTMYESGGNIYGVDPDPRKPISMLPVLGLTPQGKGWELFLDADIPGQLEAMVDRFAKKAADEAHAKPAQIGRHTLVCDGVTMASVLDRTIGIATQVDRALGYEANAGGTSYLSDPLAMLGQFEVASPLVTVTANRSALGQLATVKWDDEGVVPEDFTLVKDGVLVDYQTTREQAAWLAPWYRKQGRPVRSHGCAAVESALVTPMQHMPNLALQTGAEEIDLDMLVASVKEGILIRDGRALTDFMARTGTLQGTMHEIRNGRIGRLLTAGEVMFDTLGLWRHVVAVGGKSALGTSATTRWPYETVFLQLTGQYPVKGQPPQLPSYNVRAPAATITEQAVINPRRKA